ncbi:MAG: lipopolysaccharide biosynthesis protein [Persicimonas sp.]
MSAFSSKIVSSGKWVGGLRIAQKILGFAKNIILARLLAPDDFGLFGVAVLILTGFETLSKVGVKAAVIQAEEVDELFLHTAYWLKIARGALIGLTAFLVAPLVAQFFGEPQAADLVRVLALTAFIGSFSSIGTALLQKEFDFRRHSLYRFIRIATLVGTSIIFAFILQNAWALVWGILAEKIVSVVVSFFFHPYRPRFRFDWSRAKSIFDFGVWLFLAGLVQYASLNLDDIMLGRWAGAAALGLYQMAFVVGNIIAQEFSGVIERVMFPAFAEIQGDRERTRRVFEQLFTVTATIIVPSAVGLAVVSPEFVTVVFDDKWLPMIPLVTILSFSAAFRALSSVQTTLFVGVGKPNLMFYGTFVRSIVLVLVLYPLFLLLEAEGIALAAALSTLSALCFYYIYIRRILGPEERLLTRLLPSVLASGVMAGVLIGLKQVVSATAVIQLPLLITCGVVIYFVALFPLERLTGNNTVELLTGLFRKLRERAASDDADAE